MAKGPKEILEMSDYDLMSWTLSGQEDSYVHKIGETAMNMRSSLRVEQATRRLVDHTKRLVLATWGVVLITLATQVALIYLSVER